MSGVTVTSTARLVVYNYYNNATTGNLVFVAIGSSLARFYEFTVPSNSDYVEVCGRVAVGYEFRFLLTKLFYENTVSFSKSDSLTSGTAKTISIPVVGYSGQRIMASITIDSIHGARQKLVLKLPIWRESTCSRNFQYGEV
jgi:hypothetical protein